MNHNKLEKYSFWWSEVRLALGAIALFLGGVPSVVYLIARFNLFGLFNPVFVLLNIAYLISGASAIYLLYRFFKGGRRVFDSKHWMDLGSFAVMVISGINLGLTAVIGQNPGLSITAYHPILIVVGIFYLVSMVYLYRRFRAHGNRLF